MSQNNDEQARKKTYLFERCVMSNYQKHSNLLRSEDRIFTESF